MSPQPSHAMLDLLSTVNINLLVNVINDSREKIRPQVSVLMDDLLRGETGVVNMAQP